MALPGDHRSNGLRSLLVVVGSALLGIIYFRYLTSEPFPPDIVRLVPVVWLAGSIFGGGVAVRALRREVNRVAAGLALLLAVPSALAAGVFVMAALMGD